MKVKDFVETLDTYKENNNGLNPATIVMNSAAYTRLFMELLENETDLVNGENAITFVTRNDKLYCVSIEYGTIRVIRGVQMTEREFILI